MNSKQVVKKLKDAGFVEVRQNGTSHKIMAKKGFPIIPVPMHGSKDLPVGTLNGILKKAGLK